MISRVTPCNKGITVPLVSKFQRQRSSAPCNLSLFFYLFFPAWCAATYFDIFLGKIITIMVRVIMTWMTRMTRMTMTWIVRVIGVEARTERHRWCEAAKVSGLKLPWWYFEFCFPFAFNYFFGHWKMSSDRGDIIFIFNGLKVLLDVTLWSPLKHSPARRSGEKRSSRVAEKTIWEETTTMKTKQ